MKIRRIIRKLAAVTGYVLLLCYFLGAKWTQLFDIRMIGLFFAGVLLLCIPFLGKNRKQVKWHEVIGSNALTAGYIEAFMLLFSTMSTSELMREGLLCEMGLDLRPILYGYILHIVLSRPPVPEKNMPVEKDMANGIEQKIFVWAPAKKQSEQENVLDLTREQENVLELEKEQPEPLWKSKELTRREREIAELAARGLSNREIAEELCITETTVKKHLSNIFEKLEINSRERLK